MSASVLAKPDSTPASILIVDDRRSDLEALSLLLKPSGCDIVTATSGAEGLKHVLRTDFAVILLDMMMPGMNGFEFATLVRSRERSSATPIIFLTAAHDDAQSIYRAYTLGAVDYIIKPPDESVLRAKVAVFVDLFRKEQRIRRQAELLTEAAQNERDLRVAEERLKSEKRYRALVEIVPAGVVQTDASGNVVYVNRAFRAQSGTGADRQVEDWFGFVHPDDRERARLAWQQAKGEDCAFRIELRLCCAGGGHRWYLCDFVPERDQGGWLAFFSDCNDLKLAVAMRDEFLAIASHELRNPLTPVRNSVHILKKAAPGSAQSQRAVDIIERQVDHLSRLVDDLLDVSRLTSHRVRLQLQRLDLAQLVRRTVEDLREGVQASGVELRSSIPPSPIWVEGDATRLSQVVGNLLGNACKFTPRGGWVELSLAAQGASVELRVQDSGVGISADLLPRLFEPFTQGDRTLDRSRGGLGLGLALAKGLVQLHDGTIHAHSEGPGRGATFVVRLPVSCGEAPRVAPAGPGGEATRPRRVLVIDDNLDTVISMREVLEMLGHTVSVGRDGAEGIAVAREFAPEIVFCDIGLPAMDGYEVARQLRTLVPSAVLVAVTGYARPEDQRQAREAGFHGHLCKPTRLEDIEALLARL